MKINIKLLITFIFTCSLHFSANAKIISLEGAVETESIKVEYFDTTKRGIVRVKGCEQCKEAYYSFKKQPTIIKNGRVILFDYFLTDFRSAKNPTLFLDPKDQSVLRIKY